MNFGAASSTSREPLESRPRSYVTFTAVVTCHAASPARIITNLLTQSRRPDEILVFVSDPTPEAREQILRLEDEPGIEMFIVPNRDDWGHEKRALGLDRASCEF